MNKGVSEPLSLFLDERSEIIPQGTYSAQKGMAKCVVCTEHVSVLVRTFDLRTTKEKQLLFKASWKKCCGWVEDGGKLSTW